MDVYVHLCEVVDVSESVSLIVLQMMFILVSHITSTTVEMLMIC